MSSARKVGWHVDKVDLPHEWEGQSSASRDGFYPGHQRLKNERKSQINTVNRNTEGYTSNCSIFLE